MTYVVYADVLFVYHVLIQLALFFMIQTILGQTIRIARTVLWANLMAALSTGIFLITASVDILYYILYATSYFFMTYFFVKFCGYHTSGFVLAMTVTVSCIWLSGMMQLFDKTSGRVMRNPLFYMACMGSVFSCRVFRKLWDKRSCARQDYEVTLFIDENTITANAFTDTGNQLQNPYTGQPAIIINYRLLKKCLSKQIYNCLEEYHKTGKFPYIEINRTGTLQFFPIPYHTIGNRFSLMPAIRIPKLIYTREQVTLYGVTAGISREVFFDNRYDVLLNEKLKPKKEETA